MKKSLAVGAAAIQGDWPVLEDGFFLHPMENFYVLSDGFGGKGAGDLAAKIALTEARSALKELSQKKDSGALYSYRLQWQLSLHASINKNILEWNAKRAENKKAGVSLLLAQVSSDRILTVSHVGACTALLLRAGHLSSILLPQADLRGFASFLLPQQALGLSASLSCEYREISLLPRDILLMGTSGFLWEHEGFLEALLQSLRSRAEGENLSEIAKSLAEAFGGLPGNSLNRSLVLVEVL